jgi:ribosomal protein L37AE/L43A
MAFDTRCDHALVQRVERRNPRLPLIVWVCQECQREFAPVRKSPVEPFRELTQVRRLRRELEEWRNG